MASGHKEEVKWGKFNGIASSRVLPKEMRARMLKKNFFLKNCYKSNEKRKNLQYDSLPDVGWYFLRKLYKSQNSFQKQKKLLLKFYCKFIFEINS